MSTDPRRQIRRRNHATTRLRSLTTGIAIAGVAGTTGFGLLAAMSWSGNATTVAAADGAEAGPVGDAPGGPNATATAPPAAVKGQPFGANPGMPAPAPTTAPRVQKSRNPAHAATGGSNP